MKPRSIVYFERFYVSSVALAIMNMLLNYGPLRELAISKKGSPGGVVAGVLITAIIGFVFYYFIARRASNTAKWILVAMTTIGILMLPSTYLQTIQVGPAYTFVSAICFVFQLAAIGVLFRKDAVQWFKDKGLGNDANVR